MKRSIQFGISILSMIAAGQMAHSQVGDLQIDPFLLYETQLATQVPDNAFDPWLSVHSARLGANAVVPIGDLDVRLTGALGLEAAGLFDGLSLQATDDLFFGYGGIGLGPVDLTFGHIWGAGSLAPTNHFNMPDATELSGYVLRLDYDMGALNIGDFAISDIKMAASYDIDGTADDFELGLSAEVFGWDLSAGYQHDQGWVNVALEKDFGAFDLMINPNIAANGAGDRLGLTLGYDVTDQLNLSAHISMDTELGVAEDLSLAADMDLGMGRFGAELRRSFNTGDHILIFSYQISLGPEPQAYSGGALNL